MHSRPLRWTFLIYGTYVPGSEKAREQKGQGTN